MNKKTAFTFILIFSLSAIFLYKAIVTVGPASSIATISVDPPAIMASVGENFTININISDVVDLYGWEFKLRWNNTLLDAVDVSEGSFLEQGGSTFFAFKINNTEGYILVDCTLLGDVPGVSGNGTLAIVKFYAEGRGESILGLYDTTLVSSAEQPISHTVNDGYGYFKIHDVAITNVWPSKTEATPGETVYIYVTIQNQGDFNETFTVKASYTLRMDPIIGTKLVTLLSGANTTLTFTWDTTGLSGYCTISATASVVSGETDTADNTYTDDTVCIGSGSSISSEGGSSGTGGRFLVIR